MMIKIEKEKPKEPSKESKPFFENIPRKKIEVPRAPEKPEIATPQETAPEIPITERGLEDTSKDSVITKLLELHNSGGGEVIDNPEWIEKMNGLGEIIVSQATDNPGRLKLEHKIAQEIIKESNGQLTEGFLTNELTKAIKRIEKNPQE